MAEKFYEKRMSLRDLREFLFLPALIGGGSLGYLGSNVLTEKLNTALIQIDKNEHRIEALTNQVNEMDRKILILQERIIKRDRF